ncbi:hypothetical protein [Pontibacter rugosus]
MKTSFHSFILLLFFGLSLVSCKQEDKPIPPIERMSKYTTTKQYPGKVGTESLAAWKKGLPAIQDVQITSTADGQVEPALFYASESSRKSLYWYYCIAGAAVIYRCLHCLSHFGPRNTIGLLFSLIFGACLRLLKQWPLT